MTPGATLFCSSRTSAMVSLSTTCFGRLESVESCTALLCDCGGTRSRSCGAASRQPVSRAGPRQGKEAGFKAVRMAVRLGGRGRARCGARVGGPAPRQSTS